MIDLKYHIASLVAVFLALGIGILVGSTLLGNDTLIDYQKQVTTRLETQLENLRLKNETIQVTANNLEVDLNNQKEFNSKVFPALVSDRLAGANLAVIETNGYHSSGDLLDALEQAGAQVISTTSFLNYSSEQLNAELGKNLGLDLVQDEAGNSMASMIASITAGAIISGEMTKIEQLLQANIIQVAGSYGLPLGGIVITGGSQDEKSSRLEELDRQVIDVFQSANIPVYGVEETTAGYSYIDFYQKQRLAATVDNIDTIPGKLALILSIDGHPGHYGIKPSAQQFLPDFKSN